MAQTSFQRGTTTQKARSTVVVGILIDVPEPLVGEDGVRAPAASVRACWIGYTAEEIINWRTERRQGDTVLTLVVLRDTATTHRVLRLDEQGRYEVSVWADREPQPFVPASEVVMRDRFLPTCEGVPLDFIPFVFLPDSQAPPSHQSALETDIEEMAALGARLLPGAPLGQETATANLTCLAGADSSIHSLVTTVSQGLMHALQIYAWWAGFHGATPPPVAGRR
jgi:Domain of unknown function (DUF4055)